MAALQSVGQSVHCCYVNILQDFPLANFILLIQLRVFNERGGKHKWPFEKKQMICLVMYETGDSPIRFIRDMIIA